MSVLEISRSQLVAVRSWLSSQFPSSGNTRPFLWDSGWEAEESWSVNQTASLLPIPGSLVSDKSPSPKVGQWWSPRSEPGTPDKALSCFRATVLAVHPATRGSRGLPFTRCSTRSVATDMKTDQGFPAPPWSGLPCRGQRTQAGKLTVSPRLFHSPPCPTVGTAGVPVTTSPTPALTPQLPTHRLVPQPNSPSENRLEGSEAAAGGPSQGGERGSWRPKPANFQKLARGEPGWLRRSSVQLCISAQVLISGSGVQGPQWAPLWVQSLP